MAERIASIVLLVEDVRQENLLRHYLKRNGQENRNIRVRKSPSGRGSGEQFIREHYASEVEAIRSQSARTRACLITMIDADTGLVNDRRHQLERALRESDQPPRESGEPILNLIPKRNVETWILCLNSEQVDEITDYRHDPRVDARSIREAAATLFEWTRPNAEPPNTCVPSLHECLPEFDRIPR